MSKGKKSSSSPLKSPLKPLHGSPPSADGNPNLMDTTEPTSDAANNKMDQQKESFFTYRMHRVRFFDYEPQAINCIARDEENSRIALARSDGSIEIWKIGSEKLDLYQQIIIAPELDASIEALLWHNSILYRAGLDGDLIEYDMQLLKPKKCIPCHAGAIWCLDVNKAQSYIAAGTEEGCVVLFEYTGEGFKYYKSLQKQDGRILSLSWHKSGELIVTGGVDNIRLWSVESGHVLQRITIARQAVDKETIVWAVAVLQDKTIISGDSRGKVTFWNGSQGTQLKMFGCHRADILSLCVSQDETQVYAAGIDPVLVQFELAPVSTSSDWMVWHRAAVRAHHTHDVRALVMINGIVISGGVDCSLVAVDFVNRKKIKTVPIPQRKLVHVAKVANKILFQHSTSLNLWALGNTNTSTKNRDTSNSLMPLSNGAVHLLELRSRNDEHIVCSDVSSDANWIAYADRNELRLFYLTYSQSELLAPKISATRLKGLPSSLVFMPIRCLKFTNAMQLIVGYVTGCLKCIQLKVVSSVPQLESVTSSEVPKGLSFDVLHLMEVSSDGTRVVICDTDSKVLVYSLELSSFKLIHKLPRKEECITAMTFSPDQEKIAVVYGSPSQKVMEYSLIKGAYLSHSSSKTSDHLDTVAKAVSIRYSIHDSSLLLVHDVLGVRLYNSTKGLIAKTRNLFDQRYVMHFEELTGDFAVMVERSPLSLSTIFPQALSKQRFGT